MTQDPRDHEPGLGADGAADGNTISPLPGEPGIPNVAVRQRVSMSKKGLLAVALLIGSMVAVAAYTVQRVSAGGKKADEAESKLVKDKPTAATSEPRRIEMPPAPTASAAMATAPRILLFDEPTRGIDVGAKVEIYRLINQFVANGGAVVMVSSELPEVIGMSDRIMVIHEGTVTGFVGRAEATQETLLEYATGHRKDEGHP